MRDKLVTYITDSYRSNAMKSANPHSGIHETNISKCLDQSGSNPACDQGGTIILQRKRNDLSKESRIVDGE